MVTTDRLLLELQNVVCNPDGSWRRGGMCIVNAIDRVALAQILARDWVVEDFFGDYHITTQGQLALEMLSSNEAIRNLIAHGKR